jgi:hypothetical protein
MLTNTPRWSHTRGNTVAPYCWQATVLIAKYQKNNEQGSSENVREVAREQKRNKGQEVCGLWLHLSGW